MNRVILLLGSNVGERPVNLKRAMIEISRGLGKITMQSSVYETAAWGNPDQDSFLNCVVVIECSLSAQQMIHDIISMEEKMGRVRTKKWEPRVIDIDILFFNDEIIDSENLVVPHQDLHLRKFTLMPLAELIPEYIHPVLKKTISVLLSELNDPLEVKKNLLT